MPLRARIAFFGTAMVAVAVFGFAALLNGLATAGQPVQQDRDLEQRAGEVARAIRLAKAEQLRPGGVTLAPIDVASSSEVTVEVLGAEGTVLFTNSVDRGSAPAVPAGLITAAASRRGAFRTTAGLRLYARSWSRSDLGLSGTIVTGQPTRVVAAGLAGLRAFLVLSALITVAAALVAGWWIAGRALRPLRQAAATADEIGQTGDLDRRLPPSGDDLGLLAASFNAMLDRLGQARSRLSEALAAQRRFVADASHELRTPLTSIRTNAGFMLRHPELNPADRADALADVAAEAERMSRLVEDLLLLARADSGLGLEVVPVEVGPLVEDVLRQAARVHPDRVLIGEVSPAPPFPADADALRQLLWILIDNAVRHTDAGGRIRILCEPDRIEISDDGGGIPPADLERIFDRFHQSDASRNRAGAGLGLSIGRWIAEQHGGTITASNNAEGGATLTIHLPAGS